MAETDHNYLTAAGAAVAAVATGLFGWLTGKQATSRAAIQAETDQVQQLLESTAQQRKELLARLDSVEAAATKREDALLARVSSAEQRADRLAAKISAQGVEIDKLHGQIVSLERQRNELQALAESLRVDLDELATDNQGLREHVDALSAQVQSLGQQPAPRPVPVRDAKGQFSKSKPKGKR